MSSFEKSVLLLEFFDTVPVRVFALVEVAHLHLTEQVLVQVRVPAHHTIQYAFIKKLLI
jgi:hypothetical protein